jgi:ribonuclease P protein component
MCGFTARGRRLSPSREHRIAEPSRTLWAICHFCGTAYSTAALTFLFLRSGCDEANLSAQRPKAREAARLSPPHVDTRRSGDPEGPAPPWSGAPLGLSGRPPRVRGRTRFRALAASPRRARNGVVTVHFLAPDDGGDAVAVAYAVGRHIGRAVVRNRCRRRLRAIAAEASTDLAPGAYLIGVGRGVVDLRFGELRELVIETMRRAAGETR